MYLLEALWSALRLLWRALSSAQPEGFVVVVCVILPILTVALHQIMKARKHLEVENRILAQCRTGSRTATQDQQDVEQTDIDSWLEGSAEDSLVGRAVYAVWSVRSVQNPDLEAISTMLGQSEVERLSFARSAPNLLVLAGLFGTVLGLAGAVGTLGPQIQGTLNSADPLTLTRHLGYTLEHMRNAFACTLWGILAAVVVAVAVGCVARNQDRLLAEVQRFGLGEFAPLVLPRSQVAQFDDIRRILTQSRGFLSKVSTIMADAAERFETVLTSAGAAMQESVQQLKVVANGMQETLVKVAGDVRDGAERLRDSSNALQEYHGDLRNTYSELRSLFEVSRTDLERQSSEQLQAIGALQGEFGNSAVSIVSRVDSSSERLSEATGSFADAGRKFEQVGLESQTRLDTGFQRVTEAIDDTLQRHRQAMDRVDEHLRSVAGVLRDLSGKHDPTGLPAGDWGVVIESLSACAEDLRRIQEERGDLNALLQGMRQLTERLNSLAAVRPSGDGETPVVVTPTVDDVLGVLDRRLTEMMHRLVLVVSQQTAPGEVQTNPSTSTYPHKSKRKRLMGRIYHFMFGWWR